MSLPTKPSITTFGSVAVLTDAVPVRNASQELAAAYVNNVRNDLTGLCQVIPMCRLQVVGVSSGNPAITGSATWSTGLDTVWASSPTPIAFLRNGTGDITVTMPGTVQDFLGNNGIPVNVRDINVSVQGTAVKLGTYTKVIVSSNQFRFVLYDTSFSANDFTGQNIVVSVF